MFDKLKKTIHYIIFLANEGKWPFGTVKLAKSVVLSDVSSLYYGKGTITGVKIVKAPHGPVPEGYARALRELVDEGLISVDEGDLLYEPTSYKSLAAPDSSGFTEVEKEILKEITEMCCMKYTATALSDLTHNETWKKTAMGEEIPFEVYFPDRERQGAIQEVLPPTSEQIEESLRQITSMGYHISD